MSSSTFSRSLVVVPFNGKTKTVDPESAQAFLAGAAHRNLLDAPGCEMGVRAAPPLGFASAGALIPASLQ
jgi:hypothetical protein